MFKLLIIAIFGVAVSFGNPLNGFKPFEGRIVGGKTVKIEDHPHQISLQLNGRHRCGGSIIGTNTILTAAHCVHGIKSTKDLTVRVGSANRYSGGQLVKVASFEYHKLYHQDLIDYDVAIVTLARNLEYSNTIRPIALASAESINGDSCVVSGWGNIKEGGPSLNELQAVEIKTISRSNCRAYYGKSRITDRMMCAGIGEGGKGSCQGDSGGPLVANGTVVGIVSWAYGCARPIVPTVFADVPRLFKWINARS